MRATLIVVSLLLPLTAAAQTVYNPDGTPSMLAAEAQAGQGGIVAPSVNLGADFEPPIAANDERFDVDCDPDIEVCVDPNEAASFDDGYDPTAYQQFEAALDPYGSWVDDPTYGRVWVPSAQEVGTDFMPYASAGQWVASNDYGFAWASDYDWGWAPFHYGRWCLLGGFGWSWIPGTIWGPSWVDWRYGGGYVGWAPLGPRGVRIPPPRALGVRSPWRFALANELFRRNPTFVPNHVAQSVFARTTSVRNLRTIGYGSVNARINLGPPLAVLSRDLGRTIPTLGLRNTAPSTLPRANVTPRPGVPLHERTYARAAAMHGGGIPAPSVRPTGGAYSRAPVYRAPAPYPYPSAPAARAYAPQAPVYRPPSTYPSTYAPSAPYRAPTYQAPVYRAAPTYQVPSYQAPMYHAPAPSAPVYRPSHVAPAPSAPMIAPHAPIMAAPPSGGFGGGGHRRH